MAHQRPRHLTARITKFAKFWPVVGILGLRQSGKSTLLRDQLKAGQYVTFDEEDIREDAESSVKQFLSKLSRPVIIDEAQKVPKIFDQIKAEVDKKKIPGDFYVTGSSNFTKHEEISESLTGRI